MSLNMKKLIDQTDFDNINDFSKKWKKQPIKPNTKEQEVITHIQTKNINKQKVEEQVFEVTKRNHIPQIIDEDTEHFKNRLENLINSFKTDALSQFIGMKKSMLEYQRQTVKSDTQKYLTMYEEKHQELLETRQKLINVTQQSQKQQIQIEKMVLYIDKLNQRVKITRHLSRPFSILYQNKTYERMQKFKMNEAKKYCQKKLKQKCFKSWLNELKAIKKQNLHLQNQKRIQAQVSEILAKFQKQNSQLKERLAQITKKNQEYEESKQVMQQTLKKAFLRGVCAMNIEAMSVFGQDKGQSNIQIKKQNTELLSNHSFMSENIKLKNSTTHNQSMANSNIMFLNEPKAESKDHKWKEAPIVGIQEKNNIQQPRQFQQVKSQFVKPSNEGKVIRIVDGKSAVETKTNISHDRHIGNSRRTTK